MRVDSDMIELDKSNGSLVERRIVGSLGKDAVEWRNLAQEFGPKLVAMLLPEQAGLRAGCDP